MKNIFLRLSTFALALAMTSATFVGCFHPSNPDNSSNSSVTEPLQITTTIYEISKHGNLVLYMYGSELFEKGFEHGDVLEIAIADKTWDVPLCSNYSDVDNGETVLRASAEIDGVVLAINMGDFATTSGIAQKTAIEEDPGYRWDYLTESPVQITITMKEEGGYRDQWLIRQLVRTNERTDYPHLSDEAFANFRAINTTGIGENVLYRSSTPINPLLGRNTYADNAARDAGIATVINLADTPDSHKDTANFYYDTCNVAYVNLGTDFLAEETLNGISEGMRFIINNNGPYLIHCNEGKDRAGFVSALLECLMGATIDEVIDDYMLSYYNYYGVEEGSERYNAVVNNNLIKVLNTTFQVDDVYKADLAAEAEAFLMEDAGLTAEEVATLKAKLTISLQEVYDAGKNFAALLGNHENVYAQVTSNGKLIWEEYFSKQYYYCFLGSEYMDMGFEYTSFTTDHSQYTYVEDTYSYIVTLTENGIIDLKEKFATDDGGILISWDMVNDDAASIIEKDGVIIVSSAANADELLIIGDGVVSCVETYTLDATTREMISVKTVYTYEDGTVEEGIVTITRDVEAPEGMKPFLAFEQESVNLRTITIVSNPGAENEKVDTVQVPNGVLVELTPEWDTDKLFTMYADAACTQPILEIPNDDSDVTIYIKWDKELEDYYN